MKKQIIIIAGLVSVIMTPRAPRQHSLRVWFWRGGVIVYDDGWWGPAHMRGQHLHSKLYTLLLSRCARQ